MNTLRKYIIRLVMAMASALLLSVLNMGIALPVNIFTGAAAVFLGVPGIALSVVLCNFIL